ncbi:hypothetical protein [Legionella geestiana]|uniref:hypothetical protein n=1 Tax=Legionella geestiana TaxID=45065 RepID=UPI00048B6DA7|nr:hypothetical protein [Legionella geestiana]QBS13501.1 hypothetical protein E4T54_11730 [Legionella geestiana]STX59155.1 Putative uncharacterized protein (Precursor) [Legionella geestiana]STX59221.1 Putative uncharacterized protein (Precursor) [Legionella geestiana]
MFKWLITLLFIIQLQGCATTQYGHYATLTPTVNQAMAKDTLTRLTVLYPPARTSFTIRQSVKDPYGTALVAALRGRGYSVYELTGKVPRTQKAHEGIELAYIADAPYGNLHRVTLFIGTRIISRAYVVKDGVLKPLGYWLLKE